MVHELSVKSSQVVRRILVASIGCRNCVARGGTRELNSVDGIVEMKSKKVDGTRLFDEFPLV